MLTVNLNVVRHGINTITTLGQSEKVLPLTTSQIVLGEFCLFILKMSLDQYSKYEP